MGFDPSQLKKHAKRGKFGIKTQKDEFDDSQSVALRDQQDILTTRLEQTKRKSKANFSLPKFYSITGKQVMLYQEALEHLGISVSLDSQKTYSIDRTGFCPELIFDSFCNNSFDIPIDYLGNNFILISAQQDESSIVNPRYSFLERMIKNLYKEFAETITSFTRREPIIGSIKNAVIEQGVERFLQEGTYRQKDAVDVNISITTPMDAIKKLSFLMKGIHDIKNIPETVTNSKKIKELYDLSASLKKKHKKLSDLNLPESDSLQYGVSSFSYGDKELELYYFKTHTPVFIFFASNQELSENIEDYFDADFTILNGNDYSGLINNLLDIQMVDYLVEFAELVRDSYAPKKVSLLSGLSAITGKTKSDLPQEWHDLNDAISVLRLNNTEEITKKIPRGYEVLGDTGDLENMRGQYVKTLASGVKSKIIFPKAEVEDRLVCDLISKCNSSQALNIYRHTKKFIPHFSGLSEEGRVKILKEVKKVMYFENQNNLLANVWLNNYHKEALKGAGISFY